MSENVEVFPLNMFDKIQQHPENYKLLTKIPLTVEGVDTQFPIKLNAPYPNERTYSVVFLDTETTGMDPIKNNIIELGMVKATFSTERNTLLTVERYYDEFEDPRVPIPKEIIELTGITDDMVAGKSFDDDSVAKFLAGDPLIIAHNASFDRPFFEKRFKSLKNLRWACSLKEVSWKKLGFPGAKLEYLNTFIGYFYEAHRAYVDCLALLWIMYKRQDAFSELINSSLTSSFKVIVKGNTFSFKDRLKEKGFRFDGMIEKSWSKTYPNAEEANRAKTTIEDTYKDGAVNFDVILQEYTAQTRYK